jgi:hypothetical protein
MHETKAKEEVQLRWPWYGLGRRKGGEEDMIRSRMRRRGGGEEDEK